MIKVLAFDVDGTLTCANNELDPSLRQKLVVLSKKGMHIVLSTGRPYEDLKAFQNKNGFYTHAIMLNGAVMLDPDQNLYNFKYMDQMIAKQVCQVLEHLDLPFICYTKENNIEYPCSKMSYGNVMLMRLGQNSDIRNLLDSFVLIDDQFDHEHVFKIETVFEDLTEIEKARKALETITGIHVVSSMNFNLEITLSSVSKGQSLLEHIESLGYDESEVLVFGDSENDRSMFERFTHCVLVENEENDFEYPSLYKCNSCKDNGVFDFLEQNSYLFESV